MNQQLVPLDEEPTGHVIEGDFTATESEILKPIQATVSSSTERVKSAVNQDRGLDNIMMEAPRVNKEAAYFALKQYLVKRAAQPISREIFKATLDGVKPTYKRTGHKHVFVFHDENGGLINSYDVILIEL